MHCALRNPGPRGRLASLPISQMNKSRHTGSTPASSDHHWVLDGKPHCHPSLHMSYWMLHPRWGLGCREPRKTPRQDGSWFGACKANLPGPQGEADTLGVRPQPPGHPAHPSVSSAPLLPTLAPSLDPESGEKELFSPASIQCRYFQSIMSPLSTCLKPAGLREWRLWTQLQSWVRDDSERCPYLKATPAPSSMVAQWAEAKSG